MFIKHGQRMPSICIQNVFFLKHDLNKYINCKIVLIELNMKIKKLELGW